MPVVRSGFMQYGMGIERPPTHHIDLRSKRLDETMPLDSGARAAVRHFGAPFGVPFRDAISGRHSPRGAIHLETRLLVHSKLY